MGALQCQCGIWLWVDDVEKVGDVLTARVAYENYRLADVAASSSSTAAGSRSRATTSTNHRRTVSLSAPTSVAR
jgi:hypothetical protein